MAVTVGLPPPVVAQLGSLPLPPAESWDAYSRFRRPPFEPPANEVPIGPRYYPWLATPALELELAHHSSPEAPFRDHYGTRFTYNRVAPYVISEVVADAGWWREGRWSSPPALRPWLLSFRGVNLGGPWQIKAGRVWTGLGGYRAIDGVSAHLPYGRKLSAIAFGGQPPRFHGGWQRIDLAAGARLHYRLNETAFFAVEGEQHDDHPRGGVLAGLRLPSRLNLVGSYHGGNSSDTFRLSLDYYEPDHEVDLAFDYRWIETRATDSAHVEASIGKGFGAIYLEGRMGLQGWADARRTDEHVFYEGNLTYGLENRLADGIRFGYLYEKVPDTWCRSLAIGADKQVFRRLRVGFTFTNSRFDDGRESNNEVEGMVLRRTPWGFWEWRVGVLSGSTPLPGDTHARLRSVLEF